jgi:hypothetical protein
LSGEFQGTESFVVELTAKFVVVPSREGALGVIGASDKTSLTPIYWNFYTIGCSYEKGNLRVICNWSKRDIAGYSVIFIVQSRLPQLIQP